MTSSVVPASRWLRRWWPLLLLAVASALVVAFIGLSWRIQIEAREVADAARHEFPGNRVEALLAVVDSSRHTMSDRNRAVWAVGQLRDPRALPALARHRTGGACDHARFLCQREVEKAIALCEGRGVGGWVSRAVALR